MSKKTAEQLDREIAEVLAGRSPSEAFKIAQAAQDAEALARRSIPYIKSRCYACSAPAAGVRDQRPEGGSVEAACARHRDPTLKSYAACSYCSGPRPTLDIDGDLAHKKCHEEASR